MIIILKTDIKYVSKTLQIYNGIFSKVKPSSEIIFLTSKVHEFINPCAMQPLSDQCHDVLKRSSHVY